MSNTNLVSKYLELWWWSWEKILQEFKTYVCSNNGIHTNMNFVKLIRIMSDLFHSSLNCPRKCFLNTIDNKWHDMSCMGPVPQSFQIMQTLDCRIIYHPVHGPNSVKRHVVYEMKVSVWFPQKHIKNEEAAIAYLKVHLASCPPFPQRNLHLIYSNPLISTVPSKKLRTILRHIDSMPTLDSYKNALWKVVTLENK